MISHSAIGPDSHRAAEREIDIQRASAFLKAMFQTSTFWCEQPSSYDRLLEINGLSSFSSETSTSSNGPCLCCMLLGYSCCHHACVLY